MRWFGESWGAPVNDDPDVPHAPTPAGEECLECGHPIEEGDRGFLIPKAPTGRESPLHTQCMLYMVLGPEGVYELP